MIPFLLRSGHKKKPATAEGAGRAVISGSSGGADQRGRTIDLMR